MYGRILNTFQRLNEAREKALVGFVTAGDPSPERSLEIALAMAGAGLDILELGVPFSDPTADGPVIQRASARALAQGVALPGIFDLVRRIREHSGIPIVLFSYYNPIHAHGAAAFQRDAASAGADGMLVVDLPPEEAAEMDDVSPRPALPRIRLVAPTTPPGRIARIAAGAAGFLYLVSRTGVTGTEGVDMADIRAQVGRIRAESHLPVCVGFGISRPSDAAAVAAAADGVVVGSAFERIIEENLSAPDLASRVADKVRELKEAVRCAV